MRIQDFYAGIGSDYADVERRLGSERIVTHFALRFRTDRTYSNLETAVAAGAAEDAFRAAHTLKGVCSNLGFDRLYRVAATLTEKLRAGVLAGHEEAFAAVRAEYAALMRQLNAFAGEGLTKDGPPI